MPKSIIALSVIMEKFLLLLLLVTIVVTCPGATTFKGQWRFATSNVLVLRSFRKDQERRRNVASE